jgi:hypothetical protein
MSHSASLVKVCFADEPVDRHKQNMKRTFEQFLASGFLVSNLFDAQPATAAADNAGMPLPLKVVGNKILNSQDEPVLLRGVNTASTEWTSDGEGRIVRSVNTAIKDWGVYIIRLRTSDRRQVALKNPPGGWQGASLPPSLSTAGQAVRTVLFPPQPCQRPESRLASWQPGFIVAAYRDELMRIFVDVADTQDRDFFLQFRERIRDRFRQVSTWMTSDPIDIE